MSVKNCFNKAAEKYDIHCDLQLRTGKKLLSLINFFEADIVIDLGCGTGIISKELKYKKLYALDFSTNMLNLARKKLVKKNVIFLENNFDDFRGLKCDLAFANMSLQWSTDLNSTLANIKENLSLKGIIAFSIPLVGTFENINISTISFLTFKQVEELLSGWEIIHSFEEEINYNFPSLVEALKSLKAVGANHCDSRKKVVIPRQKIPQNLTYKIGYFIARK